MSIKIIFSINNKINNNKLAPLSRESAKCEAVGLCWLCL